MFQAITEIAVPWPTLTVPPLKAFKWQEWSLERQKAPVIIRGYFHGLQNFGSRYNWRLIHKDAEDSTIWMSITPMELEAQAHHLFAARGTVLVGGLGLGVLAYNLARKPTVRSVWVIEHDQRVIELMQRLTVAAQWPKPYFDKVRIIHDDVLTFSSTQQSFDYALLDIWPRIGDERLRPDLQRVHRNVHATEYAAWTLEMDFVDWCREMKVNPDIPAPELWSKYSQAIGVPLIMRDEERMTALAFQAAHNVLMY